MSEFLVCFAIASDTCRSVISARRICAVSLGFYVSRQICKAETVVSILPYLNLAPIPAFDSAYRMGFRGHCLSMTQYDANEFSWNWMFRWDLVLENIVRVFFPHLRHKLLSLEYWEANGSLKYRTSLLGPIIHFPLNRVTGEY